MVDRGNVLKSMAPVDVSAAFRDYWKKIRDVNEPPVNTPLNVAALNGDLARVRRLLIEKKADIFSEDQNGYTALHHAALLGRKEIAALLIELGARVNAVAHDGSAPLHKAAQGGYIDCARLLLEAGADTCAINTRGERPVDVCAKRKHTTLTAFLQGYAVDS